MRKFIFWSAALLLTLFIGGLTYVYLSSSLPGLTRQQIAAASTEPVVIAARDISLRRSITESDIAIREVPFGTVPEGAATSIEEVIGMMATSDIFGDEVILNQQIAVAGAVIQQIALTIPDNKVLVPIPLESQLVRIGLVKPGDRVDLFGTFIAEKVSPKELNEAGVILATGENIAETIAVLRDLEVHAIIIESVLLPNMTDENDSESEAEQDGVFQSTVEDEQSILVALERQDSVVVKHLLNTVGQLDIALRSPDEANEMAEVTNVDLYYLADRYGIELVRGDIPVMTEELFQANQSEFIFTGTEPSPEFLAAIDQQ